MHQRAELVVRVGRVRPPPCRCLTLGGGGSRCGSLLTQLGGRRHRLRRPTHGLGRGLLASKTHRPRLGRRDLVAASQLLQLLHFGEELLARLWDLPRALGLGLGLGRLGRHIQYDAIALLLGLLEHARKLLLLVELERDGGCTVRRRSEALKCRAEGEADGRAQAPDEDTTAHGSPARSPDLRRATASARSTRRLLLCRSFFIAKQLTGPASNSPHDSGARLHFRVPSP